MSQGKMVENSERERSKDGGKREKEGERKLLEVRVDKNLSFRVWIRPVELCTWHGFGLFCSRPLQLCSVESRTQGLRLLSHFILRVWEIKEFPACLEKKESKLKG